MTTQDWIDRASSLGPQLAEYAARHDEDGTFVEESFDALKREGYFAALVPEELGGKGAGLADISAFIARLAHACPSTALAYSMHSHLVAATVYKYRHGQPGEALLRKVASSGLILVSTGAGDWLESGGRLERVPEGYRFVAEKAFASGSPRGDLLITSGRYDDPERGPRVLHFPLSLAAPGVRLSPDWDSHGMRGTGSNTVIIDGAFIPEQAIGLDRPRGLWHPAFDVISAVALPIFMSAYVGVAERSVALAVDRVRQRRGDPEVQYLVGELHTELTQTHAIWRALVANAAEYEFSPSLERTTTSVSLKTSLAASSIRTVEKAMEVAGGSAFFKSHRIEQLLRDVRGATYHPLQPKKQHLFSGRAALGLDPTTGEPA